MTFAEPIQTETVNCLYCYFSAQKYGSKEKALEHAIELDLDLEVDLDRLLWSLDDAGDGGYLGRWFLKLFLPKMVV